MGSIVVPTEADRRVAARVWALDAQEAPLVFTGASEGEHCRAVAWGADGSQFATGSREGVIHLWSPDQLDRPVATLEGNADRIGTMALGPGETVLVSSTRDGLWVWDLSDLASAPTRLDAAEEYPQAPAVSADGAWLAAGNGQNAVLVWNLADLDAPAVTVEDGINRITAIALSPDGARLAVADEKRILVWELEALSASPEVLTGHADEILSLAFSPDGRALASSGLDRTIRLWDVSDPERAPLVLSEHPELVFSLAFAPDGQYVYSGSNDWSLCRWIVDLDTLGDRVCEQVHRNLTQDEWEQYLGPGIAYRRTCPDLPPGGE
jgi:WD40 repeat protein